MKKIFICHYCKDSFVPKDTHKNREHPFCSRRCANLSRGRKTNKEYYEKRFASPENREKKRERDREYSAKNREKLRLKAREYWLANKVLVREKQRKYAEKNKDKKQAYFLANKDVIRKNHAKWCAKQRRKNPIYKLHDNITSLIGLSLKTGKCGKRTKEILGYSIDQLKKHLEKLFKPGMTWENYGKNGWHVDHRIPLRVFNITSVNDIDFKRAWSITNLQPLWAHDNLAKNGKIEKHFQPSLALVI
jgi:endogenous inhibitor of DNA gyrase (YacG/DUF329 family)